MKEYVELLGLAKARIDNGFSQVGKSLRPDDPADDALMLLASRAVASANALMLLARGDHSNEALPLWRSLAGLAAEAEKIAAGGPEAARRFLSRRADWDPGGSPRDLAGEAERWAEEYVRGNAQGLPWGHVFSAGRRRGIGPEELLRTAAVAMGRLVAALERRWPGKFEGADQILQKAIIKE